MGVELLEVHSLPLRSKVWFVNTYEYFIFGIMGMFMISEIL